MLISRLVSFISLFLLGINMSGNTGSRMVIVPSANCDDIPEMNKEIVAFVETKIKKKVGRGECWDLAAAALELVDANWNGKYKYGKRVYPKKECIYPGDMIQFEGVLVKYTKDGANYKEKMAHHTAVIYEVKGKGHYTLAHQNTGFSGRKVGLSELRLDHIAKGRYYINRPVK